MKIIITESQYSRSIDSYISYLLEPHEVKISKSLPNHIFWVKDGEVIAGIDQYQEHFYLDHKIWDNIHEMFNINYHEAKSLMKIWLEKHYGLKEFLPATHSMWLWNNKLVLRDPK